jgi:hypothetical protein
MFDIRNLSPLKRQRAIAKLTKMSKEAPELFVATHLMAETNRMETEAFDKLYKQSLSILRNKMVKSDPSISRWTDDDIALSWTIAAYVKWGTFTQQEFFENSFENSAKILVNMKKLPERFLEVGRHATHDVVA